MALHRLTSVAVGVPDVRAASPFYEDFGLTPLGEGRFATADGGEQLRLVESPVRRLMELGVGVDDEDDLNRAARDLDTTGLDYTRDATSVRMFERGSAVQVRLSISPRYKQVPSPVPPTNAPGCDLRTGKRAPGSVRERPVRPRKLGHVVVGTVDLESSEGIFVDVLGFKLSDRVKHVGPFLRCSTDHHNLMVMSAPVPFMHHTSWQVDDIDDVGRGAATMLEADPARHVWGLGRHNIGGNFFWYLRDPAGNFAEYYSDLDVIVDDAAWTPELFGGRKSLCAWGPPPPPSFLRPDDLAELMTQSHSRR
jgi:catechol 2,3-dioxygenase-like lactoylglutathione lyase family enzyme